MTIYTRWPVAVIALAQLFGTSLWFSANSAADDLMQVWQLSMAQIGWLTSAVQLGFIAGTLVIALGGIADHFRASRIFVSCAIVGSVFNAAFAYVSTGLISAIGWRFMVGVCLADIYPLGMKLIVSWAPQRTGYALAQLVAMLTLGTALPHALRGIGNTLPWQSVMLASSLLALVGACLIYRLGDGPHLPHVGQGDQVTPDQTHTNKSSHRRILRRLSMRGVPGSYLGQAVLSVFAIPQFRAAAWGYFGHMWELYAFWTLVPRLVSRTALDGHYPQWGVSGLSFALIAAGAIGSLAGGVWSQRIGSARVAVGALATSFTCALIFMLFWHVLSAQILLVLLLVWGASVVADSPQFSALSAKACPPTQLGAALAMQNAIGFAITVVSISATTTLFDAVGLDALWLLLPGPMIGLVGFFRATHVVDRG